MRGGSDLPSRRVSLSAMGEDEKRIRKIREKLLAWYAVEARELPWRNTRDPYAIFVSEIMLQQTRVETVLAYYGRFLERFPTVESLASASVDDVLKAWEGLGYYRRAQNLHRAARILVKEHEGQLPTTTAGLRSLPGIGPYTAGAIASIAFGLDEPVLDGNVVRVLARLYRIGGDPAQAAAKKRLRRTAELLLPRSEASRFNQALMDLGTRICLPRTPRCRECPLEAECDAHHAGEEGVYPQRRARKAVPHIDVVAGIIWNCVPFAPDARLLIAKREEDDMLGGLWEFPGGRVEEGESHEEALIRELREEMAIDVDVIEPFMQLDHAYTHFRMTLHAYHCRHTGGDPQAIECADWAWVGLDGIDAYALSTADRRILAELQEKGGSA
ncbi:MAG: A/G-specific adenine glycosylase [Candidatus Bipolaricaulia bacterium]